MVGEIASGLFTRTSLESKLNLGGWILQRLFQEEEANCNSPLSGSFC